MWVLQLFPNALLSLVQEWMWPAKGFVGFPDVLVLFHCHCVRFVLYLRIGLPLYQL